MYVKQSHTHTHIETIRPHTHTHEKLSYIIFISVLLAEIIQKCRQYSSFEFNIFASLQGNLYATLLANVFATLQVKVIATLLGNEFSHYKVP